MSETYNDIKNALNKAFIDYNLDSVESLCPSFLYNNKEENKKIISTLKEDLKSINFLPADKLIIKNILSLKI